MTAAYTNDPISQEQSVEKTALPDKSVQNKKEFSREENTEVCSAETMKLATGGQDQAEIPVNHERPPLCTSAASATSTFVEQKDEGASECKSAEGKQGSECSEGNEDISAIGEQDACNSSETKNEVSIDCDPGATRSSEDSNLSARLDALLVQNDSRNGISGTRGVDRSSPKDNLRMQELQNSIENVVAETIDLPNSFEVRNETDGAGIRNVAEETYDPESELNFHEAVRAGDAKCVAALLARDSAQNLDEPDWNVSGDPPLLVAATNHCLPVLR